MKTKTSKLFFYIFNDSAMFLLFVVICLIIFPFCNISAAADDEYTQDPIYRGGRFGAEAPPAHQVRETIDPVTGHLRLIHTEIDVPVGGGLNLTLMRFYDSDVWSARTTSASMGKTQAKLSPLGIGWYMHMGLLRNAFATTSANEGSYLLGTAEYANNPIIEMPDGSQHVFFADKDINTQGVFLSKDYWVLKRLHPTDPFGPFEWELRLPDGTLYKFEFWGTAETNRFGSISPHGVGYTDLSGAVAQCTKIENAAGNSRIEIEYDRKQTGVVGEYSFIKAITDTTGHKISFAYNESLHQLQSINFEYWSYPSTASYPYKVTKQIASYTYESLIASTYQRYNYLKSAQPPVNLKAENENTWNYEYEGSGGGGGMPLDSHLKGQLTKIVYPQGGTFSYTYADVPFNCGNIQVSFRVIKTKTTGGRDITPGTWTYSFDSPMTSWQTTTINQQPNELQELYQTHSWGNNGSGNVWKIGLPISRKINLNGSLILLEEYNWGKGSVPISNNDVFNHNWFGGTTHKVDTDIHVPLLSSKLITRDGRTYTTNYSNYDEYGNPLTISESGAQASRTLNFTYWKNVAKNIVKNRPLTKVITGDANLPGTFSTGYDYFDNGFLKQINRNGTKTGSLVTGGVITQYTYYPIDGNLNIVTDANGHTTTYKWYNGMVSEKNNSIYSQLFRNEGNGTVNFEQNGRGYKTRYEFDAQQNLTKVTPPSGKDTLISYPTNGSYAYRAESFGTYNQNIKYDGYGRKIGTDNTKGVIETTQYKANGSVDYQDSNIGDKIYYDYFGRVVKVEHKDGQFITYAYTADATGLYVTVTDEISNIKKLTFHCFGDPDDKLLVSVTDPGNIVTSYKYNILGSLTEVKQGVMLRTYKYDTRNFLESETTPESGLIKYQKRKLNGTIEEKVDGNGILYKYSWDNIDRLKSFSVANGSSVSFVYDNADNREKYISPAADITVEYNSLNKALSRTEIISGSTYTTTYTYDPLYSYMKTISYPSGRKLGFEVDENYRVREVLDDVTKAKFIHTVNYMPNDEPDNFYLGNGIYQDYSYDTRNFNTKIAAGAILNKEFVPDSRGNTTDIKDILPGNAWKNQAFTYDPLNRIKTFNGPWGSGSFGYDNYGNRKIKTLNAQTDTYVISPTTNRLDSISGADPVAFSYNSDGTLSSDTRGGQTLNFAYDDFRNISQVNSGANVLASYGYDADGVRVTKAASGRTTVYHHDEWGNILSENYTNGKLIADYVYFNGKLIAKIDANVDFDGDGVPDSIDPFPTDSNEWLDTDGDGIGNNADTDDDGDGYIDSNDAFPLDDSEWFDTDNDGIGNNLDTDDDNDGVLDVNDAFPLDPTETVDSDGDGVGDNGDVFPIDPTEWMDTDLDGIGNNSDIDDDNDGMPDTWENTYGLKSLEIDSAADKDNDALSNLAEYNLGTNPALADSDGDAVVDGADAFPLNPAEWFDTDHDGIGNNADTDDDNDGIPDTWETDNGLDPLDAADAKLDYDADGLSNKLEYHLRSMNLDPWNPDSDADGTNDGPEFFGSMVPVWQMILGN